MKHIILMSALLLGLASCNVPILNTPEAKAKEVCTCIRKNFDNNKIGSMIRECNKIRKKHSESLNGDALKRFNDALEECSGDMMEEGLNNLFN